MRDKTFIDNTTKERIDYLDVIRGLCMILIVWYHTDHPRILDYTFYNSTLFFVSGVLFKPQRRSFKQNIYRKAKRLLVPFLFFYLVYYVFLICLNYAKYHYLSHDVVANALDIFRFYTDNDAFTCNYPLWFLLALFWAYIMANVLSQISTSSTFLLISSLAITIFGFEYLQHIPTPFIIGRSFTFLFFFMVGFAFKDLIICGIGYLCATITVWSLIFLLHHYTEIPIISTTLLCVEQATFALGLTIFCRYISKYKFSKCLIFFGVNSMVVLGMHDMYLTILRIIFQNTIGNMNLTLGALSWCLTLALMVPTIWLMNKYVPALVGKKL